MADPAAALSSLLRASSIQDHDEVLRTANAAIKASKTNLDAHHTRVVALLKLDRFDDALRALAEGGDQLGQLCLLEKAYALYKTGQLADAEVLIKSVPNPPRSLRHLAAQVAYRAEKFEDAATIYRGLPADSDDAVAGEENDLRINTLAANAQLEWAGRGHCLPAAERQPSRDDLEAFETAYNAACSCIARTDLSRAAVLLKRAKDLCEASGDLTDDEKKAELLPIMVQQAYVLARMGKDADALALQRSIVVADIPEAPTRTIAQNNEMAVASDMQNPFLTSRLIQSAAQLRGNDRLFDYQASILRRNQYTVDLHTQKFAGVESATSKTISNAPTPTAAPEIARLGVVAAAAHVRMRTGKDALQEILPMLEKRPTDIGLLLTIIQLYVQTQNPGPALALLDAFLRRLETATTPNHEDVRFAPGLVAVAVALYRQQGRHNSIRAELARASKHWRSKPNDAAASLLQEAGVELLQSSKPEDIASAGATFERLVAQSQDDTAAVAGLVASLATTDHAKTEPYLKKLTPVDRLTAGVDVETLIHAGVVSIATAPSAARKRVADADPDKAARRRKKKRRLPQDYEEGKKPDPERWLPMRDRSTYRPKGKKSKKRAQEATQGGAVKEEGETLELVGGAGAVKVEKTTQQTGGKKKKKGKK